MLHAKDDGTVPYVLGQKVATVQARSHYTTQHNQSPFYIVVGFNLLWSIIVDDEYDVSTRQLQALFTYWCHVLAQISAG